METKEITIQKTEVTLLRYDGEWVLPQITTYEYGPDDCIAMLLFEWKYRTLSLYTDVTVNLDSRLTNAEHQFIDTNNNGNKILEWLEKNKFGERTENYGESGFCRYPEFHFNGENFQKYKEISNKIDFDRYD